mmetsp:Transcript_13861/g.46240  ORF Transcript_13861/g.46240 Transcript_13861/m.46240 type:complete len:202 (+) Transcript_13861:167-772(+)
MASGIGRLRPLASPSALILNALRSNAVSPVAEASRPSAGTSQCSCSATGKGQSLRLAGTYEPCNCSWTNLSRKNSVRVWSSARLSARPAEDASKGERPWCWEIAATRASKKARASATMRSVSFCKDGLTRSADPAFEARCDASLASSATRRDRSGASRPARDRTSSDRFREKVSVFVNASATAASKLRKASPMSASQRCRN